MPGNFIQFDQMPMADRNKSTEKQVEELRNYIKGVMDQLRYELRKLGNGENGQGGGTSGDGGTRADKFGYPVGSIYISTKSTNPTTLFGGTWVRLPDRFLLGAGETFEAGNTGGEAEHTLTENEMPNHRHLGATYAAGWNGWPYGTYPFGQTGYIFKWPDVFVNSGAGDYTGYVGGTDLPGTQTTGGGAPHNNMPPYLVVYMWERTA